MTSTIPKLYEGTPTITVNDNRGLSVRQIQYNRTEAAAERDTLITRSVFNEIGHPTSFMDPRFFEKGEKNQSQVHNLAGQTLRIDSVDAGWRVALLDIEGAVHKEWSAHGTERRYEYDDELHRPIAIYEKNDDINNGIEQVTERFVYGTQEDMSNNLNLHLTRHYDLGGLSETDAISLSGGPLSQQRRLFKDVTAESNWKGEDENAWQSVLDTSIFNSKWTYNALGVQLTLQDAKNNIQRSEYGISGQLVATYYQAIGKAEFAVLSSITYNANGQVLTETAGNGVVSCYTYDERDWRLVQATTTRPTKEGRNAQLQILNYGYDPVGNIVSIKDSAQATRFYKNQRIDPELTYTYDALYQLLTASGRENDAAISTSSLPSALIPLTDSHQYNGYTRQYHYDRSGNLESVQHSGVSNYTQNMVISDTSNRVVQQTVNSPIRADNVNDYFDVHGNLKKLEHNKELSWGRYDQLKRVELTAQQSEVYQYTTQGDRIRKVLLDTGNSTETEVIYLPGLELRTTTNISNDSVKEELLVSVLMNTGRNQVRVQHWKVGLPSGLSNDQCRYSIDNHLGSSNLELDSEANILTQEEYYPFGGTAVWSAKSATEAKYKYVRYSGKERDATGLYYYGYRYYMPWMGRWLNPDPAWNIDGLNLYRMVMNNPVILKDNDGLMFSFTAKALGARIPAIIATSGGAYGYEYMKNKNNTPTVTGEVIDKTYGDRQLESIKQKVESKINGYSPSEQVSSNLSGRKDALERAAHGELPAINSAFEGAKKLFNVGVFIEGGHVEDLHKTELATSAAEDIYNNANISIDGIIKAKNVTRAAITTTKEKEKELQETLGDLQDHLKDKAITGVSTSLGIGATLDAVAAVAPHPGAKIILKGAGWAFKTGGALHTGYQLEEFAHKHDEVVSNELGKNLAGQMSRSNDQRLQRYKEAAGF